MKKTLLSDINLTNKVTGVKTFVPSGTVLTVEFHPTHASRLRCTLPDGNAFAVLAKNGRKYFGAPFTKEPTLRTMEKWSDDAIARTVTGCKCEPDGHGEDGSPSWMLVAGLI